MKREAIVILNKWATSELRQAAKAFSLVETANDAERAMRALAAAARQLQK